MDGKEITTGFNEEQVKETNPVPSASGTSTGFINKESMEVQTLTSTVISGDGNTVNIKQSSSFNPHPDKRIEFNVQDCVHTFTGREEFIKAMHENISKSQLNKNSLIRSKLIVICGMAGVGKTQVARKYIQTYKELYHHVIWISAEKQSDALSCFIRLAAKLQIDVTNDGKLKAEDILDDVYDFICQKDALIVYDNVGSYSTDDSKDGLQPLLPRTMKTGWKVPSIIVTTRNRSWVDFMVQELEGFELRISLLFLAELKFEDTEENSKLLKQIAELYQGLPLVLQQVLHFVRNKREHRAALGELYTLSDFVSEVSLNRRTLISTKPADLAHLDVYSLYDMTFKEIGSMNFGQNALQCLKFMTLLHPDFIPIDLLKCIFRNYKPELGKGLSLLHKYNLVTGCRSHFQMHRIVQAAKIESDRINTEVQSMEEENRSTLQKITFISRDREIEITVEEILHSLCELMEATPLNSENLYEILINVVLIYDQTILHFSDDFLNFQRKLLQKVGQAKYFDLIYNLSLAMWSKITSNSDLTITGKYKSAVLLQLKGNYDEAQKLFYEVLDMKPETQGLPFNDVDIQFDLLNIFLVQGKYNEAEKLCKAVVASRTELQGSNHQDTLHAKHCLGVIFNCQGKYIEAESVYNEVIDNLGKVVGGISDIFNVKQDLAVVLKKQGKYVDAQKLYREILDTDIQTLGSHHQRTIKAKFNLASIFQMKGKCADANELTNEILDAVGKKLGPDHPLISCLKYSSAVFYQNQTDRLDAEELYNEVSTKLLDLGHTDKFAITLGLAECINYQGKYNVAQQLYSDVLDMQIKTLEPEYTDTIHVMLSLAYLFENHDKYTKAQEIYNDILGVQIKIKGLEHSETLTTTQCLVRVLESQCKHTEAEQLYNEVLERMQILGPEHPVTIDVKHSLAVHFVNQGKCKEAEELLNEVLAMRIKILGSGHPDTISVKFSLAKLFGSQGKYTEAEVLCNEVLDDRIKVQGMEYIETLDTKLTLAILFEMQGKHNDAQQIYSEVLNVKVNELGPEHLETINVKHGLAVLFEITGKYDEARELYNEVLDTHIKILGPEHKKTVIVKHRLAVRLESQGKYTEAQERYYEVLEAQIKSLGPEHTKTINVKHSLARLFVMHEKYSEAQKLYNELLDTCIKILGPEHKKTVIVKHNLAVLMESQGKYTEAQERYYEVLEARIKNLGPEHTETINVKHSLAILFEMQEKYSEAQKLYNEVLDTCIKILGRDIRKLLL